MKTLLTFFFVLSLTSAQAQTVRKEINLLPNAIAEVVADRTHNIENLTGAIGIEGLTATATMVGDIIFGPLNIIKFTIAIGHLSGDQKFKVICSISPSGLGFRIYECASSVFKRGTILDVYFANLLVREMKILQ